jgi:pimeloyl-ACP methyl ester carboxylesterase
VKKPDIVILHGWGLSQERFAPLSAELRKRGFHVVAPDMPGFGTSKPPDRPYQLIDYVMFVHEFLKKERVKSPVFIGHSFGGRVALLYQKTYPADVHALVLTGTPGFTPLPKRKLMLFIALAKIFNVVFSVPPLHLLKDYARRWYYYVVGARDFFRAEGHMRETFKIIVRTDLVPSMEAVSVPTLLLWGEFDIIVPVSIAQHMEHLIPTAKLIIIPEADHGLPFKQPEVFAKYTEQFINRV